MKLGAIGEMVATAVKLAQDKNATVGAPSDVKVPGLTSRRPRR